MRSSYGQTHDRPQVRGKVELARAVRSPASKRAVRVEGDREVHPCIEGPPRQTFPPKTEAPLAVDTTGTAVCDIALEVRLATIGGISVAIFSAFHACARHASPGDAAGHPMESGMFRADVSACSAVFGISGEIDFATVFRQPVAIRVERRNALVGAAACDTDPHAEFRALADLPAATTVRWIHLNVDAGTVAGRGRCAASAGADALLADGPFRTGHSAAPTMICIGGGAHTDAVADFLPRGAVRLADALDADLTGGASKAACTAIRFVTLQIDTDPAAGEERLPAVGLTIARHAGLPCLAGHTAGTAVLPIAAKVGAGVAAAGEPRNAGDHAGAAFADLATTTGRTASATVRRRGLQIHTAAPACLKSLLAGRGANAGIADLTRTTGDPAAATMATIRLGIDAGARALHRSLEAAEHAFAVGAEASRWAGVAARTAVARVAPHVDAASPAFPQPLATGGGADARRADLPGRADDSAAAAVQPVGIRIDASTIAVREPIRAAEGTGAERTDFILCAGVPAAPAMQATRLQIDALPIALGRPQAARRLHQLRLRGTGEYPDRQEADPQSCHSSLPSRAGRTAPPRAGERGLPIKNTRGTGAKNWIFFGFGKGRSTGRAASTPFFARSTCRTCSGTH